MSRLLTHITTATAKAGIALLILGTACYAFGARVNTTKSIPVGLYWTSNAPIEKGAYVMFCPTQITVFKEAKKRGYIGAGLCNGNFGYMMKKILAAKNDVVTVADDGVRVNGVLLPLSQPLPADKTGRPLPRYQAATYTLGDSELLLMSDVSGTSFDACYSGPINRTQIKTVITPVITW